eukprot:353563-Chlamydomonas_euryale.AAC.1
MAECLLLKAIYGARYLCARTLKLLSCVRAPLPPVWKTQRYRHKARRCRRECRTEENTMVTSERQKAPKRMPDRGRIAVIRERVLLPVGVLEVAQHPHMPDQV